LEKGNLSEQEKILAGKNSLSKKVFSLSKKGFPFHKLRLERSRKKC
jgi:hypothetical protein